MREEQPLTAELIDAVAFAMAAAQVRGPLCDATHPGEAPGIASACLRRAGHSGEHEDAADRRWPQTDSGWARYIIHVSECPDCRRGIDCREAEELHAAWKSGSR